MNVLARSTTALFVPGDRPERFEKARRSGADVIIVDLEDAVVAERKALARENVTRAIDEGLACIVRVSAIGSSDGAADLAALAASSGASALLGVMLAKAESADDISRASTAGAPVIALIETAGGIARAGEIAAHPDAARLALGAQDLSADLGIDLDSGTMAALRGALVLASRVAGLPAPWDSPSLALDDADAVVDEARRAVADGFGGKLCVHPAQIEPVRRGFAPTQQQRDWAQHVIDAAEGAARMNGEMVDRPVMLRAERILARAAGGDR